MPVPKITIKTQPLLQSIDQATIDELVSVTNQEEICDALLNDIAMHQPAFYKTFLRQIKSRHLNAQFMVGAAFMWWALERQQAKYKRSLQ